MSEKKYIKGIYVKDAHENAPDFVLGQVSIRRKETIKSLKEMDDEFIDIDIMKSKKGEVYGKLNTYKKEGQTGSDQNDSAEEVEEDITPDDIPF